MCLAESWSFQSRSSSTPGSSLTIVERLPVTMQRTETCRSAFHIAKSTLIRCRFLFPSAAFESQCSPSTIREGVAVIVRTPTGDAESLDCLLNKEVSPGSAFHEYLSELIADKDIDATDDYCVSPRAY